MTDPFLILHKVRGEPAFDIATRLRCPHCQGVGGHNVADFETGVVSDYEGWSCSECEGLGFWWIIPTSGHRAYPYWNTQLSDIQLAGYPVTYLNSYIDAVPMPDRTPDHYATRSAPRETIPHSVLNNLIPKITRRI